MTVRIIELYPGLAARSCAECSAWMFDDKQGEFGQLKKLADGRPMPRPVGVATPCHQCPKIPSTFTGADRVKSNAIDPAPRSFTTYWHYQKCRAVNRYPEDELFEVNATIISQELRSCDEARDTERMGTVAMALLGGMVSRL